MKLEALYIGKLFYFINVKISHIAIFGNQKIVLAISWAWDRYPQASLKNFKLFSINL
ncbi:MAG: hypothetical protein Q8J66_10475 [Methylotenera sp.]|nr:hypothetical protein [Methylotenera sp.]